MDQVYVNTPEALRTAIDAILLEPHFIAVDTEFRREDTFFPQLCLIQIATSRTIYLIDALALGSVAALYGVLENPNLLKVFHSGRQDLEIFCHLMGEGRVVSPVFDTQVAAMFLSHGETAGFETLVQKLLGIKIDKSSRHTNWAQRPLSESQINYAAADVLHLRPLYELLTTQLAAQGKLSWAQEESRQLEVKERLIPEPGDAWKKLSLAKAGARELFALQRLSEWRESTAQQTDTPRSWVLKDDAIQQLARRLPSTMEELQKSRYLQLSDDLMLAELLEIVLDVMGAGEALLPESYRKPTVTTKQHHNLLDMLKLLLQTIAQELDIAPKVIADKEQLIQFVLSKGNLDGFPESVKGWRGEVFWNKAVDLYRGKASLRIQSNSVTVSNG